MIVVLGKLLFKFLRIKASLHITTSTKPQFHQARALHRAFGQIEI